MPRTKIHAIQIVWIHHKNIDLYPTNERYCQHTTNPQNVLPNCNNNNTRHLSEPQYKMDQTHIPPPPPTIQTQPTREISPITMPTT